MTKATQLSRGERQSFAAWKVEASAPNQLLMCDFLGNTRSWLMIEPRDDGGATRLYFGSAIVPRTDSSGRRRLGPDVSRAAGVSQALLARPCWARRAHAWLPGAD